jgi:ketosteroid isomerase-like protein
MSDPNQQIDELYDAWLAAFRRRDVDAILALLTPDYLLWAPSTGQVDSSALAPRLAAALQLYDIEPSFQSEERIVSGDLAFERGWDVQQITPRAGGDPVTQRQRVFMILRRQPDGRWLFARGMSQPGPAA